MWTSLNHPGGFGRRWRYTTNQMIGLSCWNFQPNQLLEVSESKSGIATFKRNGVPFGSISWELRAVGQGWEIVLSYMCDGLKRVAEVTLTADHVARSGSRRWWWQCPGCMKRCGKLFIVPRSGLPRCRTCGSITYASRHAMHPARLDRLLGSAYAKFIKRCPLTFQLPASTTMTT